MRPLTPDLSRQRELLERAAQLLEDDGLQQSRGLGGTMHFADRKVLRHAADIYAMDFRELEKWVWKHFHYEDNRFFPNAIAALRDLLEIDYEKLRAERKARTGSIRRS